MMYINDGPILQVLMMYINGGPILLYWQYLLAPHCHLVLYGLELHHLRISSFPSHWFLGWTILMVALT